MSALSLSSRSPLCEGLLVSQEVACLLLTSVLASTAADVTPSTAVHCSAAAASFALEREKGSSIATATVSLRRPLHLYLPPVPTASRALASHPPFLSLALSLSLFPLISQLFPSHSPDYSLTASGESLHLVFPCTFPPTLTVIQISTCHPAF